MPELPEVETIRRVIEPQIKGLSIEQVAVRRSEVVAHPTADEFCRCLAGQVVDRMARRGKFLIIWLESGDKVVIHLRMTGCLLVTPATYPEERHMPPLPVKHRQCNLFYYISFSRNPHICRQENGMVCHIWFFIL